MASTLDDKGVRLTCPKCGQKNRIGYGQIEKTARCGKCGTDLRVSQPVEVSTAALFDALISRSSRPVVVDFWAPWCGPCRMVAPEIEKVAQSHAGTWVVAKVNTEAVPDLGDRLRIRSIPTMAVFADGREVGRTAGARPAADIEAFVDQTLKSGA